MLELNTKEFTNGFVSVLQLDDGKLIETTSTCLPLQTETRITGASDNKVDPNAFDQKNWSEKWTVGVSTQTGCPIRCKFCAVNKLTDKQGWRNLTADEIVEQVVYAVKKAQDINGNVQPNDAQLFRVLFTRMGEPALNIDAVVDAIVSIKGMYPKARIQISTIGIPKSQALVNRLLGLEQKFGYDWLELQFSIHSTDNGYRKWLQTDSVMTNGTINSVIKNWFYAAPEKRKWKATLNFALAKDTPFDVELLQRDFDPGAVFVKVSPINENPVSDENGLTTLFEYHNTI